MKIEQWMIDGIRQGLRDPSITKELLVKRRQELVDEAVKEGVLESNYFQLVLKETDERSNHFLGQVCEKWEAGIQPVISLGKRLVILRTGMVLSKTGGALDRFEQPVRSVLPPS